MKAPKPRGPTKSLAAVNLRDFPETHLGWEEKGGGQQRAGVGFGWISQLPTERKVTGKRETACLRSGQ